MIVSLSDNIVADAHDLMQSGWLIFLAMVFDGLDGYVARLARTTSDFGAQLDSLCDVVSFGVAPGVSVGEDVPAVYVGCTTRRCGSLRRRYAACAALRLARFNVETTDDDEHLYFSGLPSPAAAAVIAGFAIMFYTLRQDTASPLKESVDTCLQVILPFFGLLVALLMVSRIRYPHVTNRVLRGQRSFGHVVAVVFFFVALMVARGYAFPIAASAFALYGPIRLAWEKWVERRNQDEPFF